MKTLNGGSEGPAEGRILKKEVTPMGNVDPEGVVLGILLGIAIMGLIVALSFLITGRKKK